MASAGTGCNKECIDKFDELQKKRKYKYIIYKIDGQEVVVDCTGEPSASYDDFLEKLQEDSCRYAVVDHNYKTPDGGARSKVCFIAWSPDSCKIKEKMLYAASKESFKRNFSGIQIDMQATDYDEAAESTLQEKCH